MYEEEIRKRVAGIKHNENKRDWPSFSFELLELFDVFVSLEKRSWKMNYKPLKIELLSVHGIWESMLAMRLPKGGGSDSWDYFGCPDYLGASDADLAARLIRAGDDHAKAIRGINAYLRLDMQVGWMIEFETYRHGVECLSTSSAMHGELKELTGPALAEQKQSDLPDKVYTRIVMISYQALRSMYKARRKHRHPDWQIFCNFIETLPHFNVLIYPEGSK